MGLHLGPHHAEIIQVVVGLLGLFALYLYTHIPRVKKSAYERWFAKRYLSCLIDILIPGEINDVTYDQGNNTFIITNTTDDCVTTRSILDGRSAVVRHKVSAKKIYTDGLGCFSDRDNLYIQEQDGVAVYDGINLELLERRKHWKVYYDSLINKHGDVVLGTRYTPTRRKVFDMYGYKYFRHYHPINIEVYTPMFNHAVGALSGSCMDPNIVCICSKLTQFGPYQIAVYRIKKHDFLLKRFL